MTGSIKVRMDYEKKEPYIEIRLDKKSDDERDIMLNQLFASSWEKKVKIEWPLQPNEQKVVELRFSNL